MAPNPNASPSASSERGETAAPKPALVNLLITFVIIGPFAGALIGCVQTLVGFAVFLAYGQPDCHFREFEFLVLKSTCGGVVGIFYGAAVMFVAAMLSRQIVAWSNLVAVVAVAVAIALSVNIYEFQKGVSLDTFSNPLPEESATVLCAFVVSLAISRPVRRTL